MLKFIFFSNVIFLISSAFFTPTSASDLKLLINEYRCAEEGVLVRYGVINQRNFDRPNISILFKISVRGKPVGCKELNVVIPKGANGSEINETIVKAPCRGKSFKLTTSIFHNIKKYKKDQWFSGCP